MAGSSFHGDLGLDREEKGKWITTIREDVTVLYSPFTV